MWRTYQFPVEISKLVAYFNMDDQIQWTSCEMTVGVLMVLEHVMTVGVLMLVEHVVVHFFHQSMLNFE